VRCGATIVGRFGDHVGKIYPFAEHVTCDGGLWRGDAQPLRQYSGEIGRSRAVPQQFVIVEFLERLESRIFSLSLDGVNVFDVETVAAVSVGVCVFHVCFDDLEFFAFGTEHVDFCVELVVVAVDGVFRSARFHQIVCYLQFN
jgi:hypothetical protein